jgi:hypothetical protein
MAVELIKDNSGVFSNYLRVIDWLWYHKYSDCGVVLNWNGLLDGILSLNIDVSKQIKIKTSQWVEVESDKLNENFLYQRRSKIPFYDDYSFSTIGVHNKTGYFYTNPRIYNEKNFPILRQELSSVQNDYVVFNESFIKSKNSNIVNKNENILGVHLRFSGHYCHNTHNGPQFTNCNFYKQNAEFVNEKFKSGNYDFVYIACDVLEFYDEIYKLIPKSKILKLEYERLVGDLDWSDKKNIDMKLEVQNVFFDFLNLSKTRHLIMSVSNISFSVIALNENLTFEFFPMLKNIHGM